MTDDLTTVVHNEARSRFEIAVGSTRAGVAEYVDLGGQRVFTHTEVDDAFSGQGLAGTLVGRALDVTAEAGLRIVPMCPYVKRYLRKHAEHAEVTDAVTPDLISRVRAAREVR